MTTIRDYQSNPYLFGSDYSLSTLGHVDFFLPYCYIYLSGLVSSVTAYASHHKTNFFQNWLKQAGEDTITIHVGESASRPLYFKASVGNILMMDYQ